MAVTKTFRAPKSGSIYGSRYMSLKLEEINVDIENNTSDIKWTLTVSGDSTYYDTGVQIYINDTKVYVKEVVWSEGFPAKPGSTSDTIKGIKHDDSTGAKSISVSFKAYVYEYTYKEYGGTMELSTIPRTTECPNLDGYIESGATISLNPASDTFKHRLYYSYNGKTGYYPSSDGFFVNTGTLPLDTSFYSYTPKSTGTGDITLYTYTSDGTLIGSNTGTITVRCDKEKCKPIITATIIDVNSTTTALTDSDEKLVKGYSTAQITYTISPRNGASISSKKVNNTTLSTSPHKITNVSTGTFEIVAVDSREFDTTETYNNTLINYVPLTLDFNAFRPTPTGSAIAINFQGNYFNGSFGSVSNTLALSWKYRLKGDSSWTNGGTFTSGTDYTISGNKFTSNGDIILSDTLFPYQNNYEIAIYYTDKLVNTSTSKPVPKGKPVLNWKDDLVNVNGNFSINDIFLNIEHTNGQQNYSTNEQVIGTWIDGKPIYRKVITYTNSETIGALGSLTSINIKHGISNFDHIVRVDGYTSAGNILPIFNGDTEVTKSASLSYFDATYLQLRLINLTLSARTWYFILEYTKTTD